jgi:hypothetical protein
VNVLEEALKESELIESSGGIAPLVQLHRTKVVNRGFSRGRESTTELIKESPELHCTVDCGGVAEGLTLECRQESVAIVYRQIGVGECKGFMHIEIAKCDPPI